MKHAVRALCRLIEDRPFLSLTDVELRVLLIATSRMLREVEDGNAREVHMRLTREATARDEVRRTPGFPVASRPWLTEKGLAVLATENGEQP